jgi:hypothetical protein
MPTGTGPSVYLQQLVVSLFALIPGTQVIQLVPEGTGSDCDAVTRREASLTEAVQSHHIPSLLGRYQPKLLARDQRMAGLGARQHLALPLRVRF